MRRRGRRSPPTQKLGWPLPGVAKARATDPVTGQPVPVGHVGLIEIAQAGRGLAYVGEQHRHDFKRRGEWWKTGDLGVISLWRTVRLVDREVDRIDGASAIAIEDGLLDRLPRTTEVIVLAVAKGLPVPVVSAIDDEPIESATGSGRPVTCLPSPRPASWVGPSCPARRRGRFDDLSYASDF